MTLFSVLKYLVFNLMVAVTVTLATAYKIDIIITVSNWVFGVEAAMYLFAILMSGNESFWESILKKKDALMPWKVMIEPVWIVYMFNLDHVFNGVCMTFTALAYTYLVICKYAKRADQK